MAAADDTQLARLVAQVQQSRKYHAVSPDLIAQIGQRELQARRSFKDAVKATKNKLHQVAGAYLGERSDYDGWRTALAQAVATDQAAGAPTDQALRQACQEVMAQHASTRERLPILNTFYATVLAGLPPPRSVLDIACGLNPLTRPWLPLAADGVYYACDIYADMIAFLNQFFTLTGFNGQAHVCDLLSAPPTQPVDLVLALKILPPLEQLDKQAVPRLFDAVQARYLMVSFPAQSLGGRHKQMPAYYEQHFHTLIAGRPWQVQRFAFATELVFLVGTAG